MKKKLYTIAVETEYIDSKRKRMRELAMLAADDEEIETKISFWSKLVAKNQRIVLWEVRKKR